MALLPAMARTAPGQALERSGTTRPWAAAHAAALEVATQERAERPGRESAELRGRADKRASSAGPPTGDAVTLASRGWRIGRAPGAGLGTPAPFLDPASSVRDHRVAIRRARAGGHVPHLGEDGPSAGGSRPPITV